MRGSCGKAVAPRRATYYSSAAVQHRIRAEGQGPEQVQQSEAKGRCQVGHCVLESSDSLSEGLVMGEAVSFVAPPVPCGLHVAFAPFYTITACTYSCNSARSMSLIRFRKLD